MSHDPATSPAAPHLQAYLLGTVDFEAALALQRRLVYDIAGDRSGAALILCEHPPLITVGREGSRAHFLCEDSELRSRQWRVRWVNRGGGVLLHLPGQLAVYAMVPLDRLGLGVADYLDLLQRVLLDTVSEFSVSGETRPGKAGVWSGGRLLASVGVAVRDWVTYYGAALNIQPTLTPFKLFRCGGAQEPPMTSLARQRKGLVRPAHVRQRLVEHFAARFGFTQVSYFSDHPLLRRKARADALPSPA